MHMTASSGMRCCLVTSALSTRLLCMRSPSRSVFEAHVSESCFARAVAAGGRRFLSSDANVSKIRNVGIMAHIDAGECRSEVHGFVL